MNPIPAKDTDPTGQIWLSGVRSPFVIRVADICMRKLCHTFCEQLPPPSSGPLPAELEELSRACLLLAVEWGQSAPESTSAGLKVCLDRLAGHFWGELLPWQIAHGFCRKSSAGITGLEIVTENLDHPNSSIRLWMFDIAWCVRKRLNPAKASARLLKTVAETILHWDSALGLCRSQFPNDESFWAMADNYGPKDFGDQYRERLAYARNQGLPFFRHHFDRGELHLRRLIDQCALALTPEEIQRPKDQLP